MYLVLALLLHVAIWRKLHGTWQYVLWATALSLTLLQVAQAVAWQHGFTNQVRAFASGLPVAGVNTVIRIAWVAKLFEDTRLVKALRAVSAVVLVSYTLGVYVTFVKILHGAESVNTVLYYAPSMITSVGTVVSEYLILRELYRSRTKSTEASRAVLLQMVIAGATIVAMVALTSITPDAGPVMDMVTDLAYGVMVTYSFMLLRTITIIITKAKAAELDNSAAHSGQGGARKAVAAGTSSQPMDKPTATHTAEQGLLQLPEMRFAEAAPSDA